MAPGIDVAALRDIVSRIAHQVSQSGTHATLDDALNQLGLPASASDGSKAVRAESSVAAVSDDQLPEVARRVLNAYQRIDAATRNRIQELLWAGQPYPPVPKRVRREVAQALVWDDLLNHYQRFRALLGALFVLNDDPFADFIRADAFADFIHADHSLGARIDQHVQRNPDWTVEETFDALGAFNAADRRFALLLEGIVSGETVPDEDAQRRLVVAINPPLAAAGLELRETGTADGYPVFQVVASRSRAGRPKNLIFASPLKPDLRLSDAIDNDIEIVSNDVEIVSNAEHVLVYDRRISADGIRWRDLQAWWKATRGLGSDEQAKAQLYRRLRQSRPANSPPQQLLFDLYHDIHRDAVHDLPALLPEVWLCWDPKTVQARGADALLNLRMDFLLLVPGGGRIVLEVDGRTHYANERQDKADEPSKWIADPVKYARTMAGSRNLTLAGYDVYRFGASELRNAGQARPTLTRFFADLFRRHHITTSR
jgi:very-short-patch-repair endonuclease